MLSLSGALQDEPGADEWAASALEADLEQTGLPLAEPDLRIAAIAVARDLTLVTGNDRHFSNVPGLPVKNRLVGEPRL